MSRDHGHILILVSALSNLAPRELMKGITQSDFCITVGQMTEEMMPNYFEQSVEPNPATDFLRNPIRRVV